MTLPRVLVTGGAGFLGSHVATALHRAGFQVRIMDTHVPDAPQMDGIEVLVGDIRVPEVLAEAVTGVDSVVHTAFASPRRPTAAIWSVNVTGTRMLCEHALARGVRRLVLISSTIVTRQSRAHPVLANAPVSRLDAYRASRVEAERIAEDFRLRGLSVAVARPKTLVGPGRVGAFAVIFERIRRGWRVPVLGPGDNRYQLLDTRDAAQAIQLLATSDAPGLFGLGARAFGTVRSDLQALLDHAATGARLCFVPSRLARIAMNGLELAALAPLSEWHYMSATKLDSVVDISLAEHALSWQPERSNAQGLIDAYNWFVDSVTTTGAARTTHPVPRVHRALNRLGLLR